MKPQSVDWASARRASYLVRQTFRYEYSQPIRDLSHRLIVIPPERFGDQRRLAHQFSVALDGATVENRSDRFGNVILDVFAARVPNAIEFTAEVSVLRQASQPNRLPDGSLMLSPSGVIARVRRSKRRGFRRALRSMSRTASHLPPKWNSRYSGTRATSTQSARDMENGSGTTSFTTSQTKRNRHRTISQNQCGMPPRPRGGDLA